MAPNRTLDLTQTGSETEIVKGASMEPPRSPDDKLAKFSYLIFQIKFMVFESVLLGCFLYVLWQVVKIECGLG